MKELVISVSIIFAGILFCDAITFASDFLFILSSAREGEPFSSLLNDAILRFQLETQLH